ncbi:hypothetical protein NIES4072_69750 [Nostoc commune NIES-4072]|uniref:Uncharacterized protein n=1 Tax=Nostoc commune NIES-4072 TaxID=2005467 RepID=A0A2R5G491_NOSCO|nr:helix-turn-helix domain-containing protein [Nostoc commune]BBD70608.1 hypothetical protein NIES4070_70190 [Nostoc commune HK-02]GBG23263.1 hypothetical protein NIES4072_69750 [Nostoc commune NIES-4072]
MSVTSKIQSDSFSDGRKKRHIYIDSKLDDLPLTMEAFRVYCHLCRRAGCDNNAFPSYKSIGEACFRGSFPNSPTETLRRKAMAAVDELVCWNLITKATKKKLDGSPSSNQYRLTDIDDWFTEATKQSSLTRGKAKTSNGETTRVVLGEHQGGDRGTLGVVMGEHQGSDGGTLGVVLGEHQGSAGGTPKVYPIEDYPIEVYPLKDAPLASPPAPPTQECVCEKEELDLITEGIEHKEPTPKLSTLLLKNSKSLQQTDNPSCRPTIAGGSFEKTEQLNNQLVAPNPKSASPTSLPDSTCYTMHPTEKTEQAMRVFGLPPWMDKAGPNGWKAEFVESYRQYLNSTPRYAKDLIRQATTGEAKNALTRLSKTDSGKAEIQNHWDSFNELKERQQPTESKHNANTSNDDVLAMAIAADEERRQQELFKQERKNEYRFSPQMLELKAKLQAAVNAPKPQPNSRFSSVDLREVEAQLKLALRA